MRTSPSMRRDSTRARFSCGGPRQLRSCAKAQCDRLQKLAAPARGTMLIAPAPNPMPSENLLISVVMPCYNAAPYLTEAVESALDPGDRIRNTPARVIETSMVSSSRSKSPDSDETTVTRMITSSAPPLMLAVCASKVGNHFHVAQ